MGGGAHGEEERGAWRLVLHGRRAEGAVLPRLRGAAERPKRRNKIHSSYATLNEKLRALDGIGPSSVAAATAAAPRKNSRKQPISEKLADALPSQRLAAAGDDAAVLDGLLLEAFRDGSGGGGGDGDGDGAQGKAALLLQRSLADPCSTFLTRTCARCAWRARS